MELCVGLRAPTLPPFQWILSHNDDGHYLQAKLDTPCDDDRAGQVLHHEKKDSQRAYRIIENFRRPGLHERQEPLKKKIQISGPATPPHPPVEQSLAVSLQGSLIQ